MASLDGKIREGLRTLVAATATNAKSVVTYHDDAWDVSELPAILVDVGQWEQMAMGSSGSIPGQRAFNRQYAIAVLCIANTGRKTFAETVNAMADQALVGLSRYSDCPTVQFEDVAIHSAKYVRGDSEEGAMGMLALEGVAEVVVSEAFPDVAQGDGSPSAFTLHPGAF